MIGSVLGIIAGISGRFQVERTDIDRLYSRGVRDRKSVYAPLSGDGGKFTGSFARNGINALSAHRAVRVILAFKTLTQRFS